MRFRNRISFAAAALAVLALASWAQIAPAALAADVPDRREILFAYDQAVDAGRFDDALRLAVTGCERLRMFYLCREIADLPLQMARQGVVAAPRYAVELRRMANGACLSAESPIRSGDMDTTAFLCAYYAQQYAQAHSPIHKSAFLTRAWQYLDSIYDPPFAVRLYQTACKHGNEDACRRSIANAAPAPQRSERHPHGAGAARDALR